MVLLPTRFQILNLRYVSYLLTESIHFLKARRKPRSDCISYLYDVILHLHKIYILKKLLFRTDLVLFIDCTRKESSARYFELHSDLGLSRIRTYISLLFANCMSLTNAHSLHSIETYKLR